MSSLVGHLIRLGRVPSPQAVEAVSTRNIAVGNQGIVLADFSDGILWIEIFDARGNVLCYCYLNRSQVVVLPKPLLKLVG